jgi:hypothetical protein
MEQYWFALTWVFLQFFEKVEFFLLLDLCVCWDLCLESSSFAFLMVGSFSSFVLWAAFLGYSF